MHLLTVAVAFGILAPHVLSMPTPPNNPPPRDLAERRINGLWSKQGKAYTSNNNGDTEFAEASATAVIDSMLAKYKASVSKRLDDASPNSTCTRATVVARREWSSMGAQDRKSYIAALQCMITTPPQTPLTTAPGVRNRYDDYVASHMLVTDDVHFNGIFHGWHRHFIWQYDRDMRQHCNYTGPMPYWDWTQNPNNDPRQSPVLDGSPLSLGGNGDPRPHGLTDITLINRRILVEPGTGGGCVTTGPLANWEVRLGNPLTTLNITSLTSHPSYRRGTHATNPSLPLPFSTPYNITTALAHNPHCLTRDLSPAWGALLTPTSLAYLLSCSSSACFASREDGFEPDVAGPWNAINLLHTAAHLSVGGNNFDVYASAGDPVFYLHHAMVDRAWAVWQAQEEGRGEEVGGGVRAFNDPTSETIRADAKMEYPGVGETIELRESLDTLGGEYCYYYD